MATAIPATKAATSASEPTAAAIEEPGAECPAAPKVLSSAKPQPTKVTPKLCSLRERSRDRTYAQRALEREASLFMDGRDDQG